MAINDPANKLAEKINDLVDSKIRKKAKKSPVIKSGKVVKIDENGMPWVSVSGSNQATPVNGEALANVKPGDLVSVNIENGKCNILGNPDDPSIGSNEAKNVSNQEIKIAVEQEGTIGRAIDVESNKTIDKIDGMISDQLVPVEEAIEYLDIKSGEDIRILRGKTVSSISIAEEAKDVASATNQHFWYDDSGAYVTEVTQEEWKTSPSGFNSLFNSLGLLLRKALNNIAAFTHSAVTFYDGDGNTNSNVTAIFGKDGAQIGKTGESHLEMDYHSLKFIDSNSNVYFHVSDLRGNDSTFQIMETLIGTGNQNRFYIEFTPSVIESVAIDGVALDSSQYSYSDTGPYPGSILFTTTPSDGAEIVVIYATSSEKLKVFTFGNRLSGSNVGGMSSTFGSGNTASGFASHAEGTSTKALEDSSHAEGKSTTASGKYSHAEGLSTIASKLYAHAEGCSTEATGLASHAEAYNTDATGDHSHAEGSGTKAQGMASHAEGANSQAQSYYSHAEGFNTKAQGQGSHAEGYATEAIGQYAHAEGHSSRGYNNYSHAEGASTISSGIGSHAEGYGTRSLGTYSHAEGNGSHSDEAASHAEGYYTQATETYAHAEGSSTIASGFAAHSEGTSTQASNDSAHSEGKSTVASGVYSHAEGNGSTASGSGSHAEGYGSVSSGSGSHAQNLHSIAGGYYSHAQNEYTTASKKAQTTLGSFNIEDTSSTTTHQSADTSYGSYAVIIGNGYHDSTNNEDIRSNALSIKWNGDVELPRAEIKGRGDFVIDIFDANKQPIYKWYMSAYGNLARQQYSNGSWGAANYYLVRDEIHNLFSCLSISQTIGSVAAGSTKTLTFSAARTGYDPISISGWYMNGAAGLYPYMLRLNGSDIQCFVRNPTSSASSSTAKVEVQVLYCRSSW